MIHVFISYGSEDRGFAEQLADTINTGFNGKLKTRIIENEDDFDGNTWKEKVLADLNKSSLFTIIISNNSIFRQWPNQELGYALALKDVGVIKKIIPIVEVEEWGGHKPKYCELKGFITEDMDKVHYEPGKPDECISEIISKLNAIDLEAIERDLNPHLRDFTKDELRVLEHFIKLFFSEKPTSFTIYIDPKSLSESISIEQKIIEDTLLLLEEKEVIAFEHRNYVLLTTHGYFTYAPIFIDFEPQKDLDRIFQYISSYEGTSQWISGHEIKEATGLHPFRINYSVKRLKNYNYVELREGAGGAPFRFIGVKLAPHGRHEIRKSEESK